MTDIPTPELIALIERTLDAQPPGERIEWPFHPVAGEAGAQDAVRELIRRVKEREARKIWE